MLYNSGEILDVDIPYSRKEDMSPTGHLTLFMQRDGDIIVTVVGEDPITNERVEASVEFCTSGGRSQRVRKALVLLMEAIHHENLENPI